MPGYKHFFGVDDKKYDLDPKLPIAVLLRPAVVVIYQRGMHGNVGLP